MSGVLQEETGEILYMEGPVLVALEEEGRNLGGLTTFMHLKVAYMN